MFENMRGPAEADMWVSSSSGRVAVAGELYSIESAARDRVRSTLRSEISLSKLLPLSAGLNCVTHLPSA